MLTRNLTSVLSAGCFALLAMAASSADAAGLVLNPGAPLDLQQGGQLQLLQPTFGGTGCPQGTANAVVSPDGTELSILFDQFVAEAGYTNGKTSDRRSCNIIIPVIVPQGYSISIFQIDYRGASQLPQGGRGQFNVEYFFAGQRGPKYTRNLSSYDNGDFLLSNQVVASSVVWSACGDQVNLRANANVTATTNQRGEQATISVDSADVSSGIIFHIGWQRCNGGAPGNGGGWGI